MKRNLIIIVATFLIIIALMITGDVITVGEKLAQVTNWRYSEHCFYLLLASLLFVFIILPIIRVHKAPQFPALNINDIDDTNTLMKFANKLASNSDYIPNKEKRRRHIETFKTNISKCICNEKAMHAIVDEELKIRFNGDETLGVIGINNRIKEWAKSVFMITAISQNNKFDSLSVMYMNYKMIEDIILASGFRPNDRQMFNMYVNILSTSLITYCLSEALSTTSSIAPFDFGEFNEAADSEDIARSTLESGIEIEESANAEIDADSITDVTDTDDIDLGEQASDSEGFSIYTILRRIKIPGVVVGSVIEGTLNALMTLRIGYITKAYLQQGAEAFNGIKNKRSIKREAMKNAVIAVPAVIASGSHVIGEKATKFIIKLIKRESKNNKKKNKNTVSE